MFFSSDSEFVVCATGSEDTTVNIVMLQCIHLYELCLVVKYLGLKKSVLVGFGCPLLDIIICK